MRNFGLILIVLLLSTTTTFAQTGTIKGQVTDAVTGEALPGVNISIQNDQTGTSTNAAGEFELPGVSVGENTLTVSYVGYRTIKQVLRVDNDQVTESNIQLSPTDSKLGEITVVGQKRQISTATKTLTPLEDLPIAVQIVGQNLIENQQIIDLRDAIKNVSGLTSTGTYNGGYLYLNSRGFNLNNWSNFRRNGMFIWNMGHHYADYIEQVEVLKGPTAIIGGDVAPGGILNFSTKKPLNYDYKKFELKLGQYSLFRPSLDLSGPINERATLLYRVNASYEKSDSFRDQVNNQTVVFAPSITWKITPDLNWNIEGTYKFDERVGDPGLISPDGTFEGLKQIDNSTFLGEPTGTYTFEDQSLFSNIEYNLSEQFTLKNTTYYARTERTPYNIYLNGNSADAQGNVSRRQYFFNQWFDGWGTTFDIIGEIKTGPVQHTLLAGIDYMYNEFRFTQHVSGTLENDINIFDPRYGQSEMTADPMNWAPFKNFRQRFGIYVQDQFRFLEDRLHVLIGARYNVTTQGQKFVEGDAEDTDFTDRPINPRFGIVYKPQRWLSLFGSYTESFEMNGRDWIDPSINVEPTFGKQYEIGAKAGLLNERLGVTLSFFDLNKENVYGWIETDTEPNFDVLAFNADWGYATYSGALHQSRGIELDVNGNITPQLFLNASGAYIIAEVLEDPAYETGNLLEGNPKESGSLWLNYRFDQLFSGLEVGYGIFYKGSFYNSIANDHAGQVEANYTMDASFSYSFKNIKTQLNITNLTDRVTYLGGFGQYEPQWPRRAVLSISATF